MKIALINGSPKPDNSASGCILEELKAYIESENMMISNYNFRKPQLNAEEIEKLTEEDVLIFAFPLYVDGIPSHLLYCLTQLEEAFIAVNKKDILVYTLVNCGFYEGHQNRLAIEMMENWCVKTGLKWGQGVGIGAGGMLQSLKNVPAGSGPKKNLGEVIRQLSDNIKNCGTGENTFVTPNFPRFAYKLAAEMGWRTSIKANGLRRKDLFLKK
ncbi:MAG: hypothetical protein WDA24_08465 [Tissierellales bacterium]